MLTYIYFTYNIGNDESLSLKKKIGALSKIQKETCLIIIVFLKNKFSIFFVKNKFSA